MIGRHGFRAFVIFDDFNNTALGLIACEGRGPSPAPRTCQLTAHVPRILHQQGNPISNLRDDFPLPPGPNYLRVSKYISAKMGGCPSATGTRRSTPLAVTPEVSNRNCRVPGYPATRHPNTPLVVPVAGIGRPGDTRGVPGYQVIGKRVTPLSTARYPSCSQ